eukprot:COSAG04_NODE_10431_length_778_cov_0.923417_2_plen_103_part_01
MDYSKWDNISDVSDSDEEAAGAVTPLHNAASAGQVALMREMLKRDPALVNSESCYADGLDGRGAPLHFACDAGQLDCVKELLARRADPGIEDSCGNAPLPYAA